MCFTEEIYKGGSLKKKGGDRVSIRVRIDLTSHHYSDEEIKVSGSNCQGLAEYNGNEGKEDLVMKNKSCTHVVSLFYQLLFYYVKRVTT